MKGCLSPEIYISFLKNVDSHQDSYKSFSYDKSKNILGGFLLTWMVKNLPAMQETQAESLSKVLWRRE